MTFTIKPHPTRAGVTLTSAALPYPMCYRNADDSAGHAYFRARSPRAKVHVFDTASAFVETIDHHPRVTRDNAGQVATM